MPETVIVEGTEIAYRRLGSGPPLIVINGFAATSEDWDPTFIEGLAEKNELLLPDNRGMGASSNDEGAFGIATLAADCAQVIATALGPAPANVLGWSMGGFIAQVLALEHPENVASLVLLSTDHGGPHAQLGGPDVLAQLADLSPPATEQARRLLSALFPKELAQSLYAEVGDIVAAARARLDQGVIDRQMTAMDAWHHDGVGDRLNQIEVPTLVAAGTADRVIPAANALRLASVIPGAWLLQFKGAGHAFMAQHPRALTNIINEFLTHCPA